VSQLGELARSTATLQAQADAYVINPDRPEDGMKLRESTGLMLPLFLDPPLAVAKQFDLPGNGRPMGGLVGFVIIDPDGVIRVQRVDIDFGHHADQIVKLVAYWTRAR